MTHYRTNLRDLEFGLFEVFDLPASLDGEACEAFDRETVTGLLGAADRLAHDVLARSWSDLDQPNPALDPRTGNVSVPPAVHEAYHAYLDSELWRLDLPVELEGSPAPRMVWWALSELLLGANPAAMMYGFSPMLIRVLHAVGTPEQRRWAELFAERRWSTTMAFTEPDAGSDIGMATTRALPQADGSWHIEGVKRFISCGDHDLADNIVHFVLARPKGAAPGTRGLSLFVVPKMSFDPATGRVGERNNVTVTRVERKMGLHASATCEIVFGDRAPSTGWLVGDTHDGIRQTFMIIQNFRMLVGVKATATLSTAYLNALEYARHRIQGTHILRAGDQLAPRVPIIDHPDVRRSLMTQKAYAEGLRALYLYNASLQDQAEPMRKVTELLLPVVKGFTAERACDLLGSESLQTAGGSGFVRDHPFEQYVRDTRIDTLYEGTTAIQGLDLLFRRIARDGGATLAIVLGDIRRFLASAPAERRPAQERALLSAALDQVEEMAKILTAETPAGPYQAALHGRRFLLAFGDLLVGWLLQRQAVAAERALRTPGQPSAQVAFLTGKDRTARFFAHEILPRIRADLEVVRAADTTLVDLDTDAL